MSLCDCPACPQEDEYRNSVDKLAEKIRSSIRHNFSLCWIMYLVMRACDGQLRVPNEAARRDRNLIYADLLLVLAIVQCQLGKHVPVFFEIRTFVFGLLDEESKQALLEQRAFMNDLLSVRKIQDIRDIENSLRRDIKNSQVSCPHPPICAMHDRDLTQKSTSAPPNPHLSITPSSPSLPPPLSQFYVEADMVRRRLRAFAPTTLPFDAPDSPDEGPPATLPLCRRRGYTADVRCEAPLPSLCPNGLSAHTRNAYARWHPPPPRGTRAPSGPSQILRA